jgi:hypothetical protein
MAADEILDAAWAKEHAEVDRRVALAIAAHNQEDHARFRGLVTLGADFVAGGSAALDRCSVILGGIVPAGRTTLTFDSVVFDPDGWASLGASTITVPDAGDYLIFAGITWFAGSSDPSTGTRRDLMVYCTPTPNFSTPTHLSEIEPPRLASSGSIRHETMVPLHLTAGTVIQLRVDHDASGALLIGTNGNDRGMLTVMKVG